MKNKFEQIESEITLIKQENVKLKNDLEESALNRERQIDALILETIQVIDAFDKAEIIVKDKGYADDEKTVILYADCAHSCFVRRERRAMGHPIVHPIGPLGNPQDILCTNPNPRFKDPCSLGLHGRELGTGNPHLCSC